MKNKSHGISVRPSQIFDTFLDDFFNSPVYSGRYSSGLDLDMYEDGDNLVVEAKVAGYNMDDLDVEIEDEILTISGAISKEKEEENKKKKYYYRELSKQSFTRSVALPTRVDADKASADMDNGVLKIVLPKSADARKKKITLKK